ncbi:MAG TPA: protein kinase [Hyphomicrobiaceae bacterium]|nr:protein kinase [Hyphomicrobiaceae bacterium]
MEAKLAPSTNLMALPDGTELVGDYRIKRVLGTGGFGITYLADETALGRSVTIKEYFPAEFAARRDRNAVPRSRGVTEEYQWGLDRFIEEAQTLARFDHPNIVRVHRYFRSNNTGYMVLHFEEGGSFKAWLRSLKRPPSQVELDKMLAPLLEALELIHDADFLHRDIAPDNIMVRKDGSPVLIDFGSARGAIASHSRTVSALVKPGYSPYEQYATSGANQGPWTDIYALGATLYHAITGKRPPDAPSRVVNDEYVPAGEAAFGTYRAPFLKAIDQALSIEVSQRPQRIGEWRGPLFEPEPKKAKAKRAAAKQPGETTLLARLRAADAPVADNSTPTAGAPPPVVASRTSVPASLVPAPPDAPQRKGQLLDFIDALKKHRAPAQEQRPGRAAKAGRGRSRAAATMLPHTTAGVISKTAFPEPPAVLREPPTMRQRSWPRAVRRWGTGIFRVAMSVAVAGLAVAYDESARHQQMAGAVGTTPRATAASEPNLQLETHQGAIVAVASADDDRRIVSVGADATLRLWDAATGKEEGTITLPEGAATALAVDGQRALIGHQEGAVVLWDLVHGERLATFRHGSGTITSVAFVRDRLVAADQDGGIAMLDPSAPDKPAMLIDGREGGGPLIAAARARGLLVSAGIDRTVRLWKAPERHLIRTLRLTDTSAAVGIAPDASYLAGGSVDGVVRVQRSPALRSAPLHAAQTFKAHDGRVAAIALGPQGMLASAGEDGNVKLWSLRPQRMVRALDSGQVRTLSFTRDGRRLLAGGKDGVIRVWSLPAPLTSGAT